jgi:hypothetical protein
MNPFDGIPNEELESRIVSSWDALNVVLERLSKNPAMQDGIRRLMTAEDLLAELHAIENQSRHSKSCRPASQLWSIHGRSAPSTPNCCGETITATKLARCKSNQKTRTRPRWGNLSQDVVRVAV